MLSVLLLLTACAPSADKAGEAAALRRCQDGQIDTAVRLVRRYVARVDVT